MKNLPPSITKNDSLSNLFAMERVINFNPPYQRSFVWKSKEQLGLMETLLRGGNINTIHLVKENKNGEDKFIVLDGKQRLTTIFNFKNNKFRFPFDMSNGGDANIIELSWKELEDKELNNEHEHNGRARSILNSFRRCQITITEWSELTLAQQSEVFESINSGIPLSDEEAALAGVYYCKDIAQHIISHYFENFEKITSFKESKDKEDNSRGKKYIFILKLLNILLNNNVEHMEINLSNMSFLTLKGLKPFFKRINAKMQRYLDETKNSMKNSYESKEEMDKMLEAFGWLDTLKDFKKFTEMFGRMYTENALKGKEKLKSDWIIIYFYRFTLNKIFEKRVRLSTLDEYIVEFKDFFKEYCEWTQINEDVKDSVLREKTRRLNNKKWLLKHNEKLEEFYSLFLKKIKLDDTPKIYIISEEDKKKAYEKFINNGNACEKCKKPLNLSLEKYEYDHEYPASKFSEPGKITIMHAHCNRRKSDSTGLQSRGEYLEEITEITNNI